MLLKQLKYFISIVEKGNFTEAAEENYISQSAISQQIQSLESELGYKLLIREKRTFNLTPAGKYIKNDLLFFRIYKFYLSKSTQKSN